MMYLKTLNVQNFRNYENLNIELGKKINIIVGNNAQGKTNLLESIYVLALTKSHRSFIDNNLIKKDCEYTRISGILVTEEIKNKFEIYIDAKTKKVFIDGNPVKKITDYVSNMNVIIFYPEDLEIIKGAPSERRRYLNLQLGQLNKSYLETLNNYNKLLKLRNNLLKKVRKNEVIDETYLGVITEYFIEKAVTIYRMRNKYINKINQSISGVFEKITDSPSLAIRYISGLVDFEKTAIELHLRERLQSHFSAERKLGTTLVGPHRDDLEFYLDELDLKLYGSQGQQRAAILALKLTEIEIFKSQRDSNPILLLDDVFSELDDDKKNNLIRYIDGEVQTIITTTDIKSISEKMLINAIVFEITNGNLEKVKQ